MRRADRREPGPAAGRRAGGHGHDVGQRARPGHHRRQRARPGAARRRGARHEPTAAVLRARRRSTRTGAHVRVPRRAARERARAEPRARRAQRRGRLTRWPHDESTRRGLLAADAAQARAAQGLPGLRAGRRQDLHACSPRRTGAARAARTSSIGFVETARPRGDRRARRGPRAACRSSASSTAARSSRSSTPTRSSRGRPEWVLVDELAHTNVPGTRHEKRWQSVEEILAAGINVHHHGQHPALREPERHRATRSPASACRRRCPDAVLDRPTRSCSSTSPTDALLNRLKRGVVYDLDKIPGALANFFKRENLVALRELALRKTAEEVDDSPRAHHAGRGGAAPLGDRGAHRRLRPPQPDRRQAHAPGPPAGEALPGPVLGLHVRTHAARSAAGDGDRAALRTRRGAGRRGVEVRGRLGRRGDPAVRAASSAPPSSSSASPAARASTRSCAGRCIAQDHPRDRPHRRPRRGRSEQGPPSRRRREAGCRTRCVASAAIRHRAVFTHS